MDTVAGGYVPEPYIPMCTWYTAIVNCGAGEGVKLIIVRRVSRVIDKLTAPIATIRRNPMATFLMICKEDGLTWRGKASVSQATTARKVKECGGLLTWACRAGGEALLWRAQGLTGGCHKGRRRRRFSTPEGAEEDLERGKDGLHRIMGTVIWRLG